MIVVLGAALNATFVYLMSAALLIGFIYVAVRAASFAHFRTKLEYLRSVLKELRRGSNNHG